MEQQVRKSNFDRYANAYDAWFMDNENLLYSEVKLVAHFLKDAGRVLSVGCGSGLFEKILADEFDIEIKDGIEPSEGMREIAVSRGLNVVPGTAEETDFGTEVYDTVLFNGTPSYITDLALAVRKARQALKPGGRIVLIDVPKESSYGIMYNLALAVDTWGHELLRGVNPKDPYPIELVRCAHWRTTQEKIDTLRDCGFTDLQFAQTLTRHPLYSNAAVEEPVEGYDRGDYVAICAVK